MKDDTRDKGLIKHAIDLLTEEYLRSPEFNSSLDMDDSVEINGGRYPRSKVLFWVDRSAYYAAQEEWKNATLREYHADTLTLLDANDNVGSFIEIVDAVRRKRIVPFVGAGLSRPMGMPLWGEALKELHSRIHTTNDPVISALIDEGKFIEAAALLYEHSPILSENFIKTKYRIRNLVGPVLRLPKIAYGCVVTTNFDNGIEVTFREAKDPFDGQIYGLEEHNFFPRLVRGHRCLLKLHGDADNPRTYILSKHQYAEGYGVPFDFHLPLPKALRQIYVSNTLLFLGCSLDRDWTLDLFKAVKDQGEYEIPTHYAIVPKPESDDGRRRKEQSLLEVNIRPIWYTTENKHAFVERLLELAIDAAEMRIALPGERSYAV